MGNIYCNLHFRLQFHSDINPSVHLRNELLQDVTCKKGLSSGGHKSEALLNSTKFDGICTSNGSNGYSTT
jgi:hypothetical protein